MSKVLLQSRIVSSNLACIAILLFTTPAVIAQPSGASVIGTNKIELDHLLLETTKIDSVARNFVSSGFDVRFDVLHSMQPVDTVVLNKLVRIEIRHHTPFDLSEGLTSYYSGLVFRTSSLTKIHSTLTSDSIELGPTFSADDSLGNSAFGIAGDGPLDLIFMDGVLTERDPDPIDRNRIDWIILTAGARSKQRLMQVFDAIGLTKKHEGCCDYWLIGPPEKRMKIRFDFDANPADPEWLSIEPLGVIYGR